MMRAGFLVVIALQVLLYGLWSGLVQRGKNERAQLATTEKTKKRQALVMPERRLSGTRISGAPPVNSGVRTWAPIQSGSPWVYVASA